MHIARTRHTETSLRREEEEISEIGNEFETASTIGSSNHGSDCIIDGSNLQSITERFIERDEMHGSKNTENGKEDVRGSDHGLDVDLATKCI
jgi:hypothetical protein